MSAPRLVDTYVQRAVVASTGTGDQFPKRAPLYPVVQVSVEAKITLGATDSTLIGTILLRDGATSIDVPLNSGSNIGVGSLQGFSFGVVSGEKYSVRFGTDTSCDRLIVREQGENL